MLTRFAAALGAALLLALGFVAAPAAVAPASALTNVGESTGSFVVTFNGLPASAVDEGAFFFTSPGSAQMNVDYADTLVPITIPAGSTTASVTVTVFDDAIDEVAENFTVNLNGFFGTFVEEVVIADDDPAPTFSIDDVTQLEDAGGATTSYTFTVTKTGVTALTATVDYATADSTAVSPDDYTSTSGTLTFLPGVTTQTLVVVVTDDTTYEANEQFFVNLSAPTNATIADGQGVGTITDDDLSNIPSLTIDPETRTVTEGADGTSVVYTYEVYRLGPSGLDATFEIDTTDLGATAGVDYDFVAPGPYTIPAGPPGGNVFFQIIVYGDDVYEGTERFDLSIVNAVNAVGAEVRVAHVTITDDDPRPAAALGVTGSNPTPLLLTGVLALLGGLAMVAFSALRAARSAA